MSITVKRQPQKTTKRARSTPGESWLDRTPRSVALIALGAAGVLVWYGIASLEFVSPILFPGPGPTFSELVTSTRGIVSGDHVFEALVITSQEVVLGRGGVRLRPWSAGGGNEDRSEGRDALPRRLQRHP